MAKRQKHVGSRWPRPLRLLLGFIMFQFGLSSSPLQAAIDPVLFAKPGGATDGFCTSWATACELSFALSSAVSSQEIWVAAGTYKPTAGSDRTATFQLKAGVALYGGFAGDEATRAERDWAAHVTTLSGDLGVANNTTDNSYHVVTGATGATLDGFTCKNRYPIFRTCRTKSNAPQAAKHLFLQRW